MDLGGGRRPAPRSHLRRRALWVGFDLTSGAMPRITKLSRSIEGKVAIVTGAASGMGKATAELFADEGAHVALLDRSEAVHGVASGITAAGGTAVSLEVDLADAGSTEAAVAGAREALGPIDILVNNAGISIGAPIDQPGFDAAWEQTMAVNLTAYTRTIRACLADLQRDGAGRIVNIASTEGLG